MWRRQSHRHPWTVSQPLGTICAHWAHLPRQRTNRSIIVSWVSESQVQPSRSQFRQAILHDDGSPRATMHQLLPILLEHKKVLGVIIGLSMAGALTTMAQSLIVGEVIALVEAGGPLGYLVWTLVAVVVVLYQTLGKADGKQRHTL